MKSKVTKFDLSSAFKELDLLDYPETEQVVSKPHNSLHEGLNTLTEEVYSVNNTKELEQAKADQEAIAQAKLARIERIVDLDAQSEDDLLPSYVGKTIIQCPQCMTLFYKDTEDLEKSEEDPTLVNINEPCQHCGNISGYEIIGKVAADEPESQVEELPATDETDFDLNLEFNEPTSEVDPEGTGEAEVTGQEESSAESEEEPVVEGEEETAEEDIELEPVEETLEDKEKKDESLESEITNTLIEDVLVDVQLKDEPEVDTEELKTEVEELVADHDEIPEESELTTIVRDVEELIDPTAEEDKEEEPTESVEESLTESADKDLNALLDKHNQYIAYLQKLLQQDEEALERAKKMKDADEVVKALEKRIQADKEDLQAALPEAVKTEAATEELPTPEEIEVKEETTEEVTEACKNKKLEESTSTAEMRLKQFIDELPIQESAENEAKIADFEQSLEEDIEGSDVKLREIVDVSDAEFKELINSPVFNENLDEKLIDISNVKDTIAKIEAAGEEVNENVVEEEFTFDDVDEIDETSLDEHFNAYLTEVYSNVKDFTTTACKVIDNKLMVEGKINFKSGNNKNTTFIFESCDNNKFNPEFIGTNKDFADSKAFNIKFIGEAHGKYLIAESLKYNYKINNNSVKGIK